LEFTESVRRAQSLLDPDQVHAVLRNVPYPKDFVASMLRTDRIDPQDVMDWLAFDRREANELLATFVRKQGLQRDRMGYRKTEPFVTFLKKLQVEGKLPERAYAAPGKADKEKY
jgi:hypothetical protein